MPLTLEDQIAKGFDRLQKKGGPTLLFAGEQIPALVEDVPPQNLPPGIITRGVASWARVSARRSAFASQPTKGSYLTGVGQSYRVAEIEGEPTDPITSFICAVFSS